MLFRKKNPLRYINVKAITIKSFVRSHFMCYDAECGNHLIIFLKNGAWFVYVKVFLEIFLEAFM